MTSVALFEVWTVVDTFELLICHAAHAVYNSVSASFQERNEVGVKAIEENSNG